MDYDQGPCHYSKKHTKNINFRIERFKVFKCIFFLNLQVLLITLLAAAIFIVDAKPVDETIGGAEGGFKPEEPQEILKLLLLKKKLLLFG